jgi:hypothetical protein
MTDTDVDAAEPSRPPGLAPAVGLQESADAFAAAGARSDLEAVRATAPRPGEG